MLKPAPLSSTLGSPSCRRRRHTTSRYYVICHAPRHETLLIQLAEAIQAETEALAANAKAFETLQATVAADLDALQQEEAELAALLATTLPGGAAGGNEARVPCRSRSLLEAGTALRFFFPLLLFTCTKHSGGAAAAGAEGGAGGSTPSGAAQHSTGKRVAIVLL